MQHMYAPANAAAIVRVVFHTPFKNVEMSSWRKPPCVPFVSEFKHFGINETLAILVQKFDFVGKYTWML